MQVKIAIGTIAFMLTMIIFGFATLREPARMEEMTLAREGRQIEDGADLFQSNCATCHGIEGKAEQCFDAGGNQIGCQGLPLNNVDLLCGEPSRRMLALNWSGTKEGLIRQTIAAGRVGSVMPVWSTEFGGPLESHEVDELTLFVLNWGEGSGLCGEGVDAATVDWPESVDDLPEGVAQDGAGLYELTYGCAACHGNPDQEGSNSVGPWLGNIANVAAERVEGQSAAQYIYESILNPNAFITQDCPTGPCSDPSSMPANFGDRMALQDMADIVAYYLTLSTE